MDCARKGAGWGIEFYLQRLNLDSAYKKAPDEIRPGLSHLICPTVVRTDGSGNEIPTSYIVLCMRCDG